MILNWKTRHFCLKKLFKWLICLHLILPPAKKKKNWISALIETSPFSKGEKLLKKPWKLHMFQQIKVVKNFSVLIIILIFFQVFLKFCSFIGPDYLGSVYP